MKPQAQQSETLSPAARLPFSEMLGGFAALWGVIGVLGLFTSAITRLTPHVVAALEHGISWWQWVLMLLWTLLNAYGEGYRALQRRFAPRVVARALYLSRNPRPLHVLLAPAFCMALLHATRRRLIISWATVAMIVGFILLLRITPQPWRGIVDAGVVVPLAWGGVAIIACLVQALRGVPPVAASEVPSS